MTVNMKKYNFAIREWLGGDDWPEGFFIYDRDNEVYDAVDNYLNDIPFDITNKRYLTLDEIVDDC